MYLEKQQTLSLLLLFHWPESRSSHTGRHCRCPGGSEVTAGFLHFGPDPLRWTHSADEPGQTTGGSGTPRSRSEDPTRPRTACRLPQQCISWAQSGQCFLWSSQSNSAVWLNMLLGSSSSLLTNDHSSCIFQPTPCSLSKLPSTPSPHPFAFSSVVYFPQPPFNISAQAHSCC